MAREQAFVDRVGVAGNYVIFQDLEVVRSECV